MHNGPCFSELGSETSFDAAIAAFDIPVEKTMSRQASHLKLDWISEEAAVSGFVDLSSLILKTPVLTTRNGPFEGFAGPSSRQPTSFLDSHANTLQRGFFYLRMSFNTNFNSPRFHS